MNYKNVVDKMLEYLEQEAEAYRAESMSVSSRLSATLTNEHRDVLLRLISVEGAHAIYLRSPSHLDLGDAYCTKWGE